jgi:hypothetical protein
MKKILKFLQKFGGYIGAFLMACISFLILVFNIDKIFKEKMDIEKEKIIDKTKERINKNEDLNNKVRNDIDHIQSLRKRKN